MIALSDAAPGLEYTVKWNVNRGASAASTAKVGLRSGEELFLLSSFFGSVVIEINGKRVALCKDTAYRIMV